MALNVLLLYNATQTYTNTVYDHVESFGKYSTHRFFYAHIGPALDLSVNLERFDVVVIHYSLRVCFDQISGAVADKLKRFGGLKVIFAQDEYDNTHRLWHWIDELNVSLVFSVVPAEGLAFVYPPERFPGVRFVSNITGYVPEFLENYAFATPPSLRNVLVGYRGRDLPVRYGALGREKVEIARMVRGYCDAHGLPCDIAWTEDARLYGDSWVRFLQSCRATLGTESGSNVFNWDGRLEAEILDWIRAHPGASDAEVYSALVAPREVPGLMNQISPRIFEAISCRLVLVLFEGAYSGVIEADRHFLPLRKDGKNLADVFSKLRDNSFVDEFTARTYDEIISSGRYSYSVFIRMVDEEIASSFYSVLERSVQAVPAQDDFPVLGQISTAPIRSSFGGVSVGDDHWRLRRAVKSLLWPVWRLLPERLRLNIKCFLRSC